MDSLGHLRQLVALAETGNFRKAGQRLGISHSAVSQTIKRIEAEGGNIGFRNGNGPVVD